MRRYTPEFKEEAVRLITEGGYTLTEVSRNLGVSDSNVHRWLSEHRAGPKKSLESTSEQEELKRLRKENEQLRMEREILKKAAAGSSD